MTGIYRLTPQEIRSLERAVEAELLRLGVEEGLGKPEELIVRDLLPKTDLGFTNEEWVESVSAYGWARCISSIENDKEQLVAIYGVANLNPNPLTLAVKFTLGPGDAKVKDIWQIEQIYTNSERPEGYAKDYIIYHAPDTWSVFQYGKEAGTDRLVYYAKIVEKKGRTIMGGS